MKKKIIYKRDYVNRLSNIKRIRITENRDLIHGLRMNRNERVENFPISFLKKIFSKVKKYELGKYPNQSLIYNKLSKFLKIKSEKLLLTSGIDGSIKTILEVLTRPRDKIGVLSPTYAMYKVYCHLFQIKLKEIKYDNLTFKLDKKSLFAYIKSSPQIIFLPNPNQPIEDPLSISDLRKICFLARRYKVLVVVDEAYHMFGAVSAVSLINEFKNLIILKSFSKSFSVPSIRFGYVISNESIIKILSSSRLSYESNFLTDTVATYLIDNIKIVKKYIYKVKIGRDYLIKELKKLNIMVIGGKSNCLLININNKFLCKKIYKKLTERKIYVKGNYPPPLDTCILITCGPKYLMNKFLIILKIVIKKR